jgi:outer membrane protein OmpA-like peptidoglycan-associated protein
MKKIISFLIAVFVFANVNAQSEKEFKEMFSAAWTEFLYESYSTALPMYKEMVDKGFSNANVDYAIGMCYVFGNFEDKSKAIPYLLSATQSTTAEYKEGSYKENNAPQEAFYYLGRAYKINYEFDKAIEAYERYKSFLGVDEIYALEMVDLQLQHCANAKDIMKKPVNYTKKNLGQDFNNENDNYNASYSGDGNTLVFTTRMEIYDREFDETNTFDFVYFSVKDQYGGWSSPKDVTRKVGSEGFSSVTHMNNAGTRMLLYTDDWGVGNIYETYKEGRSWVPIEKIKKPISTKDNEAHACYGENESIIYFTSDRAGGLGGTDIYVTFKDAKGKWGDPINLGSSINTPYNEATPYLLPDGKTMFFSSEGHYSMGGLDIFTTTKQDNGEWSVPRNIGYPINSSDDDLFFFPYDGGKKALYAMRDPEGFGKRDIYEIEIIALPNLDEEEELITEVSFPDETEVSFPEETTEVSYPEDEEDVTKKDNTSFITYGGDLYGDSTKVEEITEVVAPPVEEVVAKTIQIKGRLSLQDNKDINSSFSIDLYDNNSGSYLSAIQPDYSTGSYSYTANPGNYKLSFSGNGYESATKFVEIPDDYASNDIMVNVSLVPIEVSSGEYFVSKSVFFEYNDFNLSRESKIEIEKLNNIMQNNPSVFVEVTGHTDSKGTDEYNRQLSVQRARSVINYLSNKGISSQRFVAKGLGEQELLAVNENPDGSDNPEGRKYNRRVDIKIIKGGDNVVLKDVNIPDYLMYKTPIYYTIWLTESDKELPPSYFSKYPNEAINNVWVFPTENGYMYTVGQYKNKADAVHLLNRALDVGFPKAEIIDSEEFGKQKVTGTDEYKAKKKREAKEMKDGKYTIQIMALRNPVDISYFKNLSGVQKYVGANEIHRYYYGKYKGIEAAKNELGKLVELGYADAFVMKMDNFK